MTKWAQTIMHMGPPKVLKNFVYIFFGMACILNSDLITFIQKFKCECCHKLQAPYIARPNRTKPWDVISTDAMQLSESDEGNKWVLIL